MKTILKIILLFIVVFLVLMIRDAKQAYNLTVLKNKIIYLDPGHGGWDPGANQDGIEESEIALKIALILKNDLESLGAKVILTRDGDYDLASDNARNRKREDLNMRVRLINKSECDLFITIHLNSISSSRWRGAQTMYYDKQNKQLAQTIQKSLVDNLGNTNRKAARKRGLFILERTTKPGVLVEVGFLSNNQERELLTQSSYQKKISYAIALGLVFYYNEDHKEE